MQSVCLSQNLDSGLVVYYPFNGNANDESENGNHGIVHGATLTFDRCGNPNSAYFFDGKSKISTQPFPWLTNQFSIVGWIKVDDINPSQTGGWIPLICRGEQSHLIDNSFGLQFSNGKGYVAGLYGSDWEKALSSYELIFSSKWSFVVATFDSFNIKYYSNGKLINNNQINKKINGLNEVLVIGRDMPISDEWLFGSLDDICIYNRVLTEQEVLMLYNMPAIRATIKIIDTIANVGTENFHIPIKVKFNCQNILAENHSFTAKMQFNASTFLPTGVTKGKILNDSIDKDYFRNLTIVCDDVNISDSDSILTEIIGTVLLGDSLTPIEIIDFKWNNSNIEIDTIINGSLETKVCAFPIRRIQLFTPTSFSIQPNPANSGEIEIKFEGDEEGLHTLNIYNIQGIKLETEEWQNAKNGKRDFKFDLKDYTNGVYYVVLKSPWNVMSKPMMVIE